MFFPFSSPRLGFAVLLMVSTRLWAVSDNVTPGLITPPLIPPLEIPEETKPGVNLVRFSFDREFDSPVTLATMPGPS